MYNFILDIWIQPYPNLYEIASRGFNFFSNRFVVNNNSNSCLSKQFKFYIMHMETIKLTSKWVQVQYIYFYFIIIYIEIYFKNMKNEQGFILSLKPPEIDDEWC